MAFRGCHHGVTPVKPGCLPKKGSEKDKWVTWLQTVRSLNRNLVIYCPGELSLHLIGFFMSLGLQTKAHTTVLLQEECQRVSGNAGSCVTSPPESVFQRGVPFFGPHRQFWLRLKPPYRAMGLPFVSLALLHCPSEMRQRLIQRDGINRLGEPPWKCA